jgi:hypothetical protein
LVSFLAFSNRESLLRFCELHLSLLPQCVGLLLPDYRIIQLFELGSQVVAGNSIGSLCSVQCLGQLGFTAPESLRACFALAKALIATDQADFSSDSACCTAASYATKDVGQYCQESVKGVKGTKVAKEQRGHLPDRLPDSLGPPGIL